MNASETGTFEWLRAIRREIQAEIGTAPGARAAFYQAKERDVADRIYRRPNPGIPQAEFTETSRVRED